MEDALYEQKKKLKSKIKRGATTEITYAVSLKKDSDFLVDNLSGIPGVKNVVLVQYNQAA